LKILVVTQYFWPENFRINDLAHGLKDKGHEITVLTGIPNYPSGRFFTGYGYFSKRTEHCDGIRVIRMPLIPRGKGNWLGLSLNFLSFALSASILAPFYCQDDYDIIFVYEPSPITVGLPAIILKKFKTVPLMFWMQDLWPESLSATGAITSNRILKIVEFIVRLIYRKSDKILIQSRAFKNSIVKQGGDQKRILYYPNSAEELYKPVELGADATERADMPDGFCVTFAGNIGAAQSFATIIDAAALLRNQKNVHWVVIGDGRMYPWVVDQVKQRNLNRTVHLLGRHPTEMMPRYFALSDVLLVTLKKEPIFALTIPSKVQSYLACAKPIVAAMDGEGAKVIEEAGAGMACPAENPKALAETVLKFYNMSEADQKEMGNKGREYFEKHFEREMLFDRLEGWMKELVTQRHKGTKKEVKE